MAEPYAQIGANDRQVIAGEDLALVGVELVGKAPLGQALAEAIQEPVELFRVVILRVGNHMRTVVQQPEEAGRLRRLFIEPSHSLIDFAASNPRLRVLHNGTAGSGFGTI